MPASAAQISANRQNCLKSTGPKTPEGKDISRRNGLKHGLSGSGPLILEEDANEIDRRTAALSAELDPKSAIGAILVVQLATLSVKMERGAKRETAALGVRVRHATEAFDEARLAEARRLFEGLAVEPVEALRLLKKSPEGVDLLVAAWTGLRDGLTLDKRPTWGMSETQLVSRLLGWTGHFRDSKIGPFLCAYTGFSVGLEDESGRKLDPEARKLWGRDRLVNSIAAEIAALTAHRAILDFETIALDRAAAPDLALFDVSKDATLARRYEAEARRGFFKALDQYRKVEAEVEEMEQVESIEPASDPAPLASLRDQKAATPRVSVEALPGRSEPPVGAARRPQTGPSAVDRAVPVSG